jgi:hypothetical protein
VVECRVEEDSERPAGLASPLGLEANQDHMPGSILHVYSSSLALKVLFTE